MKNNTVLIRDLNPEELKIIESLKARYSEKTTSKVIRKVLESHEQLLKSNERLYSKIEKLENKVGFYKQNTSTIKTAFSALLND